MDSLCQVIHKIEFDRAEGGLHVWKCLDCKTEIQEMEDVGSGG